MRLYTCQPLFVYQRLMAGETWVAEPFSAAAAANEDPTDRGDESFRLAYDWLSSQMLARGIRPVKAETKYPIWAWQQWNGVSEPVPSVDDAAIRSFAAKGTQVLLTVEIADERVLLSDYDAWHWVLNYWYMGSEQDSEDFERRCKEAGVDHRNGRPVGRVSLHQELEATWQGIFDPIKSAQALGEPPERAIVQGVFWELRPEDVVAALRYDATGPAQNLPPPGRLRFAGDGSGPW